MKRIDLTPHIDALRRYHALHHSIPSATHLAELWGLRAKSWALQIVERLCVEGVLERAPGRRLRPGRLFYAAPSDDATVEDPMAVFEAAWQREFPGRDLEVYLLVRRLAIVGRQLERGFERATADLGLGLGEHVLLDALLRLGPPYATTPARIREQMGISFAGLGKRIARLKAAGLIAQSIHKKDARASLIRLTQRGRGLLQETFILNEDADHTRVISAMEPEQRRELTELLKALQLQLPVR